MSAAIAPIFRQEDKNVTLDAAQVVRHLAHEIRQPLSTLESLAFLLDIALEKAHAPAREQVAKIRQQVDEASSILDDAVYYARACPPHPVPLSLHQLVAMTLAERPAPEGVSLHLDFSADPCEAMLDRKHALHLMRHLLAFASSLARRAPAGQTATVHVSTERRGGDVRLKIAWFGDQRSMDDLWRRFEPLAPDAPPGGGLSLAAARRIVEDHGGQLEIHGGPDGRVTVSLTFAAAR
ncbi:MAG: hypothetical protein SFV18_08875 [Bryobacteraceae bacterium]|nr:hypothetical protein [Bryobacteraceae bacterium]